MQGLEQLLSEFQDMLGAFKQIQSAKDTLEDVLAQIAGIVLFVFNIHGVKEKIKFCKSEEEIEEHAKAPSVLFRSALSQDSRAKWTCFSPRVPGGQWQLRDGLREF